MTSTYNPGVHKFAVFVVCWTILLFVAGALVTSRDAALSVPTWPGPVMPPMVGGVFYEHSHRMIAGALGISTLILAILVWTKEERSWLRWFSAVAVGGVAVQAILGGQVVIQLLHYWLPVLHACFAQIVFAAALRKRFGQSVELSRARVMLHAIFGTQFLLGFGAYWSRLTTVDAPQPMPVMVYLTVIHTVVGAILFAFSILIVLMCYRLVPRGREVRAEAARQVSPG